MNNTKELTHKIIDLAIVLLACTIAYKLRFNEWKLSSEYQLPTLVLLLTFHISLNVLGHYNYSSKFVANKPLPRILLALVGAALITALFLYFSKSGSIFSRLWFGYSLGITLILCYGSHLIIDRFLFYSSRTTRIIVIGSSQTADSIEKYFHRKNSRLAVIQRFEQAQTVDQAVLIALLEHAAEFVEQKRFSAKESIAEIWIDAEIYDKVPPHVLAKTLENSASRIVWITRLPDAMITLGSISRTGNFITMNSQINNQSRLHLVMKSLFDRTFATIALISLLPFLTIVALLIRLESSGPIFFKQSRYGLNGSEFKIWKFRTMTNTESDQEFKQATRNDSRITKVGKFLRKHSIDELPQLINVIQGSMSLVGPRPHPTLLNENFRGEVDRYMGRHCMKPGITGLAQINGFRGETTTLSDMENRVNMDLEYINHWSFTLDISILLNTLSLLWRDPNAF